MVTIWLVLVGWFADIYVFTTDWEIHLELVSHWMEFQQILMIWILDSGER